MDWHIFLTIIHIIGTALGVGGATVSDFIFLKSIKNKAIDVVEFNFLKLASKIVWAGFLILIFSGFGFLILSRLEGSVYHLIYDAKFLAKYSIVLIIFFNGLLFHWRVFPIFKNYLGANLNSNDFLSKTHIIFSTGAISIVSWYSALILGAWRGLEASYLTILGVYLIVLVIAIMVANIIGKYLIKH